jgi:hypothetical protein
MKLLLDTHCLIWALADAPELSAAARAAMARADEVLLATTTLAMCVLWTLWSDHRAGRAAGFARTALFWLCVGLGILAKGPITPFVAGTCALGCAAARRDWRFIWSLRPFTGAAVLAAIAVPWVWLAGNEVGWDTLRAAFDKEVLQRAKEGAEGHAAPPGYYVVTLMAFFFPGALLAALAFERIVTRAFVVRHAPGAGLLARVRARFGSARGRDAEFDFCRMVLWRGAGPRVGRALARRATTRSRMASAEEKAFWRVISTRASERGVAEAAAATLET